MSLPAANTNVTKRPGPQPGRAGAGWVGGGSWVIVQARSANLVVLGLLGPEGCKASGHGGDWEVHERPLNNGLTEYRGRRNHELDLNLLLDLLGRAGWIDDDCWTLEKLADTPHPIRIAGPVLDYGRLWVITDIDYRDALRNKSTGKRTRQDVMLHLIEYVEVDDFAKLPRANAAPVGTRNYTIRQGDDLQKIAQKQLGKAARWREIEAQNAGMRGSTLDPRVYRVGQIIRIPAR